MHSRSARRAESPSDGPDRQDYEVLTPYPAYRTQPKLKERSPTHMTTEERFEHIESAMTGIANTMEALGSNAGQHDKQIEALLEIAEKHATELDRHDKQIEALRALVADVSRQWQAYFNTPQLI